MSSSSLAVAVLLVLVVTACTTGPAGGDRVETRAVPIASSLPPPAEDGPATATTTALDGNRTTTGRLALDVPARVLPTSFTPTVLVAAPLAEGHLLVASDREVVAAWHVSSSMVRQVDAEAVTAIGTAPAEGRPTLLRRTDGWVLAPSTGPGDADWETPAGPVVRDGDRVRFGNAVVDDVLSDARWAVDGDHLVVPVSPTDEYGHGVLGDAVEAGALAVADAGTGSVDVVDLPVGTVLEGTGVVLADVTGDGTPEPVMTLSAPAVGARQAVLVDGGLVLGPAIGTGNRWRHLLGVDDGRIIEIVTPHLARTLQALRVVDGAFTVEVSRQETIASHRIGSRDLDRAGLVELTGDGVLDVVGPAAGDERLLRAIDGRDGSTVSEVDLGGPSSSNLVLLPLGDGVTVAAVGVADRGVVLLGGPG